MFPIAHRIAYLKKMVALRDLERDAALGIDVAWLTHVATDEDRELARLEDSIKPDPAADAEEARMGRILRANRSRI